MKVFFGCTTFKWLSYRDYYFAIRNYLRELGCIILFDWIDEADRFYQTSYKRRNITKIYQDVVQAIDEANAVVIEYSVPNFSSSHQINYALLRRRPTLVMRLTKDNPRFTDSYLEAIQSPYLIIKDYNRRNYGDILEEFIGFSRIEQGQGRYNIVLEKRHKYYLDWASVKLKKSRSQIIRNLIDKEIASDKDYHKSVNTKVQVDVKENT